MISDLTVLANCNRCPDGIVFAHYIVKAFSFLCVRKGKRSARRVFGNVFNNDGFVNEFTYILFYPSCLIGFEADPVEIIGFIEIFIFRIGTEQGHALCFEGAFFKQICR